MRKLRVVINPIPLLSSRCWTCVLALAHKPNQLVHHAYESKIRNRVARLRLDWKLCAFLSSLHAWSCPTKSTDPKWTLCLLQHKLLENQKWSMEPTVCTRKLHEQDIWVKHKHTKYCSFVKYRKRNDTRTFSMPSKISCNLVFLFLHREGCSIYSEICLYSVYFIIIVASSCSRSSSIHFATHESIYHKGQSIQFIMQMSSPKYATYCPIETI